MAHYYGYIPDSPDARDHLLKVAAPAVALPAKVDLRTSGKLPPVYDQGQLGSCVANASCAALQYDEAVAGENPVMRSRLEVYYYARQLEHTVTQDSGCMIRDAFKAMSKHGVAPETDWPYDINTFTHLPHIPPKDNQKLTSYSRVAQASTDMKSLLSQNIPIVVGFQVYASFESQAVANSGVVPMPDTTTEKLMGGHAVLVVGYDDSKSQWIVRNSWGSGWGDQGYFYMPYDYFLNASLSNDFWVATKY